MGALIDNGKMIETVKVWDVRKVTHLCFLPIPIDKRIMIETHLCMDVPEVSYRMVNNL